MRYEEIHTSLIFEGKQHSQKYAFEELFYESQVHAAVSTTSYTFSVSVPQNSLGNSGAH